MNDYRAANDAHGQLRVNIPDLKRLVVVLSMGRRRSIQLDSKREFPISQFRDLRYSCATRLSDKDEELVNNPQHRFRRIHIINDIGQRVALSDVADVSLVESAAQISRDDTRRRIVVSTNVRDRDVATFVNEAPNTRSSKSRTRPCRLSVKGAPAMRRICKSC